MYGLKIQFKESDLEPLVRAKKKIVLCWAPSYKPLDKSLDKPEKSDDWLVWCNINIAAAVSVVKWEEKYRIYVSNSGPDAYHEIDMDGCAMTENDVYDKSRIYRYVYSFNPEDYEDGDQGCYYAKNDSGNGLNFGLAQEVINSSQKREYRPCDAVPALKGDTITFSPHHFLKIFLRYDDRKASPRRAGGVSSPPIFLNYSQKADRTIQYNLNDNRFELV